MKLVYLENCEWEIDFIRYEILNEIENIELKVFTKDTITLLVNETDLINNNFFVVNCVCNFDDILSVVKVIKPIVIFFLSDESGDTLTKSNYIILEKYAKLFYRQYNHKFINYSTNNKQMPLGYVKNFLNQQNSSNIIVKKMDKRNINVSFIGTPKNDREYMKYIFENNMINTRIVFVNNNWDVQNLPVNPKEMFSIYNDSIFVINGRGNITLDCFRIYEAVVCGSIPVIVGNMNEINITFNYDNNIPPFVYANTWDEAVVICNNLLKEPEKLQKKQNEIIIWWKNIISNLKNNIKNCL